MRATYRGMESKEFTVFCIILANCFKLLILIEVNGTTGEGVFSLTFSERVQLAEAWMKEKDKIPTIIIQVGGCAFLDAQKLVKGTLSGHYLP